MGTDDAAVVGQDAYPRKNIPYFGATSKRLFVQVTCEGQQSFASNCAAECAESGKCLFGLTAPHCSWCNKIGLLPKVDGSFEGQGCGSVYCVKYATCSSSAPSPSYGGSGSSGASGASGASGGSGGSGGSGASGGERRLKENSDAYFEQLDLEGPEAESAEYWGDDPVENF